MVIKINTNLNDFDKCRYFLDIQKESLINELKYKMSQCLSATTKERLFRHAKEYNWEITSLPKTDFNKVCIIKKETAKIPEIWVSSIYTRYREAFNKYLFYYFDLKLKIPKDYHVDHSLPKLCFKNNFPYYFIRLFLVNRKINCSFGATYEKTFYQSENENEHLGGFHVNYMTILKVLGIPIPKKNSNDMEREDWALKASIQLENVGLEDNRLHYHGLLSLIYDGYKNRNIDKMIITDYYTAKIYQKHI
jgi:hypothetical protein